MNCPACQTPLAIAERRGVEIDYCPSCRGVWLDRGELDKLIERAAGGEETARARAPSYERERDWDEDRYDRDDDHRRHRRRRGGLLGELFDFD